MSYEELDDNDEQIGGAIKHMKASLGELETLPMNQRTSIVLDIENKHKRANDKLRSFRLDLREIDRTDPKRRTYDQKAKDYEEELASIFKELQWAKSGALKDGRTSTAAPENMHAMELIEMSKQTQQEDKNSLGRSKQMIAQTQETGQMTSVRLKEQRDQLENVQAGVREVETNLSKADRQIRIIAGFLLLIILAIIFIVVYGALFDDGKKVNDGDTFESDNV